MLRSLLTRGIFWALSVPLFAAETSPLTKNKFQLDPVEDWGQRFLYAAIILGILIVLYTLIRYRGRTAGAVSWALLALGIALVPLAMTGFGTILVFDKAERVEFCQSCHLTMNVFVQDMHNPKSNSLAAVHFKNLYIPDNQCYVCHTSYGMFGTVEAKESGMYDVYKYYTGIFLHGGHFAKAKMRSPYPNHDCLKCHAQSAKWLGHEEHQTVKEQLFKDEMKCLDCHGSEHPAHNV